MTLYYHTRLDYAHVVWGDQPGLTTQTKQLQSFQNRIAKKIVKGKVTSADVSVRAFFARGGAVTHLPKKFLQVAQIFTKQSKGNEGHTMH